MNTSPDAALKKRNRRVLVLILVAFFGSLFLAGALRFSGWRPSGMKNHGELLDPPGDLRNVTPQRVEGGAYEWRPIDRRWRIALAPPAGCDTECARLARQIDTVWQLLGKDADQVDVLWACAGNPCGPPADAPRPGSLLLLQGTPQLRAGLPRVDDPQGVPVYVVDPNGFVILRYAPGFDPSGLRADLAKLLKLK